MSVILLSVILIIVILLTVILFSVILLNNIVLSVILPIVILPNVAAPSQSVSNLMREGKHKAYLGTNTIELFSHHGCNKLVHFTLNNIHILT